MPKKNLIIIKSIIVWKWKHLFMKNYLRKKKINYCYGFMPGDFQVVCGSMIGENRRSLASTETPVCSAILNNKESINARYKNKINKFVWDKHHSDLNFKDIKIDWYFLWFSTLLWKGSPQHRIQSLKFKSSLCIMNHDQLSRTLVLQASRFLNFIAAPLCLPAVTKTPSHAKTFKFSSSPFEEY